jgi:tetratricopeptide (TPR) repeat protein
MSKRIFFSYSHDSDAHRDRVLALSERLREDGVETLLDQYVNGSPEQGWARWMLDKLDAADAVLVVCSEAYYRRFRGHEQPGKGRGADWEGALITQEIYDDRSRTLKFVPVFLTDAVESWIPEPLRALTYYELSSREGYESLYDFLLGRAGMQPGPIGSIRARPRRTVAALTFDQPRTAGAAGPAGDQTESAVEIYNQALRALSAGDLDAALDALTRALEIDPMLAFAYYNRGLTHSMREEQRRVADGASELRLAIEDFDSGLNLGFRDAMVFRNRGNAFSRQGNVASALSDYAQAIELEPADPRPYINRGEVYENTLQRDLAIADYRTVLRLVTEPAWKELARARLLALKVKVRRG